MRRLCAIFSAVLHFGGMAVFADRFASDRRDEAPATHPETQSTQPTESLVRLEVERTGKEGFATSFEKGSQIGRGDYARIAHVEKNQGPDRRLAEGQYVLIFHDGNDPLQVGRFKVRLRPRLNEVGPCDYWLDAISADGPATQPATTRATTDSR